MEGRGDRLSKALENRVQNFFTFKSTGMSMQVFRIGVI